MLLNRVQLKLRLFAQGKGFNLFKHASLRGLVRRDSMNPCISHCRIESISPILCKQNVFFCHMLRIYFILFF